MAGLLDLFSNPDSRLAIGLLSAAGPSREPLSFGQRMGGLMAQLDQQKRLEAEDAARKEERALKARMMGLQEQQILQQLAAQKQAQEEAARARANEDAFRRLIQSPQMQSNMDALAGGGGPTQANAARVQPVDPLAQLTHEAMRLGQIRPTDYLSTLRPKPADYKVVGDALVQVGPAGVKEAYRTPDKPDWNNLIVKGPDGQPMLNRLLLDAKKQIGAAGASSIVNYGSPVPVQLPNGQIGYVQPTNRGGPVSPMTTPEGLPLVKPTDQKDKDLTEAQSKATAFLGQMRSASKALEGLRMDQSALSVQAETALAGGKVNAAISAKAQQVRQAQDQWSEAFLRFKTGAASTKDEVEANRRTFFPIIGDKAENVAQKKAMRAMAEQDMEIAAGRGVAQLNARHPEGSASTALPMADQNDPLDLRSK